MALKLFDTASCASLLLLLLSGFGGGARAGENWTSYRGPGNQGRADAADLPIQWGEKENVVWKAAITGKAWSSPVIWGNRILLTSATEDGTELFVFCLDKKSGRVHYRKRVRHVAEPQFCHTFNSYASPTPVLENGLAYVSFGSPYNCCLDIESGQVIWERTDFVCNHFRGAGSSPFLFEDLLILHFDGSDRQYVAAMDKKTGRTIWTTDRTVNFQDLDSENGEPKREGDLRKAFSTPMTANVAGEPVLISLGSMALYGYQPETGKELWRAEAFGSHSGSCRPVVGRNLVFSPMGYGGELWAVRPDGRGVVTESHVVWKYTRAVPKRSSILLVEELLFMVDIGGVAACVEADSGEEAWRERLGGDYSASPIHASGRVYFFNEDGKATVIDASRRFRILGVSQLEEGFMASPAVSGDALYLRTRTHMYRIEEKS